jgi:hypothetical protein
MPVQIPEQALRGLEEAEAIEAAMAAPPPEAPPADPAPQPPPAPEPPAPPAAPPVDWEQRYNSLQGKYNAEVPALHTQIKDLTDKVTTLIEQSKAPPPEPAPATPAPVLTDKDREAFGEDLIDVIERAAKEIAGRQTAPLLAEIEKLRATTSTVEKQVTTVADAQAGDQKSKFFSEFSGLVPDWQDVNTNQAFLNWCGELHPLTGAPRQALLDAAFEALDATRVAALFNQWKQDAGVSTPVADTTRTSELESQIAPTAAGTTAPVQPQADRTWTGSQISKFYDDITKGMYRGKDAERMAIEAEIDRAIIDGRVRD